MQSVTWSALGAVGRSPVSKLAIIMPFIGYVILLQDKVVNFLTPLGIPADARIGIGFYLLYFGIFIFGLGSFVFHVASPETARSFRSADEYVERLQSLATASDLIIKLNFILQNAESASSVEKEANLYKAALSSGIGSQPQQSVRIFALRNFFEIKDRSAVFMRGVVFLFFSVGILLTTIPSLIALVHVSIEFYKSYMQSWL